MLYGGSITSTPKFCISKYCTLTGGGCAEIDIIMVVRRLSSLGILVADVILLFLCFVRVIWSSSGVGG